MVIGFYIAILRCKALSVKRRGIKSYFSWDVNGVAIPAAVVAPMQKTEPRHL